jgi:exonuclease III/ribonuclease HI
MTVQPKAETPATKSGTVKYTENYSLEETNDNIHQWKITTINVKGINDTLKSDRLFDYINENKIDITGITETWLGPNKSLKDVSGNYSTYTTTPNPNSYYGTGVGLILKNKYTKHIYKKQFYTDRGICIDMAFKRNTKIRVINIYNPANINQDLEIRRELHHWLKSLLSEATSKNIITMVMGDFNAIHDPLLDTNKNTNPKKPNILFETLTSYCFTDTFRHLHPNKKEFTWIGKGAGRRLDYIWTSAHLSHRILDAYTEYTSTIIDSDHKFVTAILDMGFIQHTKLANHKHERQKYINCKESTPKQWSNFEQETEKHFRILLETRNIPTTTTLLWGKFKEIIINGMNSSLKKSFHNKFRPNPYNTKFNSTAGKKLKLISKLYKLYVRWVTHQDRTTAFRNQISELVTTIQHLDLKINQPPFQNEHITQSKQEEEQWLKQLRVLYKGEKKVTKLLYKKEQIANINNFISKRFKQLQDSPRKMIDSILNTKKRSIITDRLVTEANGNIDITIDPVEIKTKIQHHFDQWTSTRNPLDLNSPGLEKWKQQYQPKSHINNDWYSSTLTPITQDEITSTLNKKQNNSAPGKSKIPYTVLKHLKNNGLTLLCKLFNNILNTGEIPPDWKKGIVYPIPKPRDWMGDINITRPITLLETTRKLFMSLINNRLAEVITSRPVLSNNNWAGLPGGSTQQPIHILNNIIEEAHEKKKEVWILSQDISKAFDSINNNMLAKALHRIRVPEKIVTIIKNLLDNRENTVITAHGLTAPYKVKDGIDQGDTISPLLWRIFYDPLLQEIESTQEGYQLRVKWQTNIDKSYVQENTQKITGTAYMDDTTWYAYNKHNMQKTLDTTSEFFHLNDINLNEEKSALICINTPEEDETTGITINGHKILPKGKNEPTRILGVWICGSGKKKFQKALIKEKIITTTKILKWKTITDKQARYIINQVLFPRIEYLLNDMVLTERECNILNSPISKVFKQKAKLPSTTIDSLLYSPFGYRLFNLWDRQIAHHATRFFERINNNDTCANTTLIRLQQLQNEYWSTQSILCTKTPYWTSGKKTNLNKDILNILKVQGITFTSTCNFEVCTPISGTGTPIESFMGYTWYNKHRTALRIRKVIYCEQIMTPNCKKTIRWQQIKSDRAVKGSTPTWFKELSQEINTFLQNKLWPSGKNFIHNMPFEIFPTPGKKGREKKKSIWTATITNSNEPTLLKHKKSLTNGHVICNHMITNTNESPIFKCTGCIHNNQLIREKYENQSQCLIEIETSLLTPIPVLKTSVSSKQSPNPSPGRSSPKENLNRILISPESITELIHEKTTIKNKMQPNRNLSLPTIHLHKTAQNLQNIRTILQVTDREATALNNKLSILEPAGKLQIYTDGSVYQDTHHDRIGIGWIIYDENNNELSTYRAEARNTPSSTKAELLAILTAILATPQGKTITIFTDSKNAISNLNTLILESKPHKKKTDTFTKSSPNYLITKTITNLIQNKHITAKFIKVKSHSGISGNEIADRLAKITPGEALRNIIDFNYKNVPFRKIITNWNQQPLDLPIKNLTKTIQKKKWTSKWRCQNRTEDWLNTEKCKEINWHLTFQCIHPTKITSTHTDFNDSTNRTFRLKTFFKELPTMEKVHTRRPDLYLSKMCVICKKKEESDLHPFICTDEITTQLKKAYTKYLNEECSARAQGNKQEKNIADRWEDTQAATKPGKQQETFQTTFTDIIRGAITHEICNQATQITKNEKSAKEAVCVATNKLWDLKKNIWKERCDRVIAWEKINNITTKDKKKKTKVKQKKKKRDGNRIRTFQEKFISLTNIALTEYLYKIDFFYNFLSKC